MKKSALQIARAAYQPKLPVTLTGAVMAIEGEPTPRREWKSPALEVLKVGRQRT